MTDTPSTSGEGVDVQLGCNYQGYEFGGGYLDSVCIDGYLWDADSGDADPSGDGWIYTHGGDIPCPICNPQEAIEYHSGYADDDEEAAYIGATSLVNDIRKNRGITEPFVPACRATPGAHP